MVKKVLIPVFRSTTIYAVAICLVTASVVCLATPVALASNAGGSADTNETTKIPVVSIVTDSSEILAEHEIRAITERLEGRTVGLDELQHAVDQINELYAEKGFITAKALLPAQTVTNGVVRIQLVEGRVGEILVEDNRYTRDSYFLNRIHLKPGDLVRLGQIEDDMIYFNLTNDVQIRAELKAGKQFGTTDVVVKALEPSVRQVVLYTDNNGRTETGVYRLGLNAVHNSIFGLRHSLGFGALYSSGSLGLSVSYEVPVGTRGAKLGLNYDGSKTHVVAGSLETVDVDSLGTILGVKVTWPTVVQQQLRTQLSLGWQSQRSDYFFSGANLVTTSLQKVTLGSTTQFIGSNQVVQVQQSLTFGRAEIPTLRSFFKYTGSLTWQRALPSECLFTYRGVFQLSDDQLLPTSEQFAVGGVSTVRGFPEGARMGDKGYLVSAELSYPISQQVKGVFFLDHGAAFPYKGNDEPIEGSDYITSFGLGANVRFTDSISGNFIVGMPARAEDGSINVHFLIQTSI